MSRLLKSFLADRRGNVTIVAAVVLPVAIAAGGIAVSYSTGASTRANMQTALDSAVLAAAGMPDGTAADEQIKTAELSFNANLNTLARSSTSEVSATFAVNGLVVSGEVNGTIVNPFGGLTGSEKYPVKVTAAATKDSTPICILGLNGLDNGAFDINGGPV